MRDDKEKAVALRKEGKSYNDIKKILGIPKSTLSCWFRNLDFSEEVKAKLINKAKEKWAANITAYNKKRAIDILEKAKKIQEAESKKIHTISDRELWLIGTSLYWAEGSKRERWKLKFTNSDPGMIKFMMLYFRNICKVDEEKFKLLVQVHPNISEREARQYWHKITGIPIAQFYKTQIAVSKASRYKREANRLPHGTLAISIHNTGLVNKLKGWIKGLSGYAVKGY